MKRIIPVLVVNLLLAGGSIPVVFAVSDEPEKTPCCFSNPRYSGQCKVNPGPEETCADILNYLNSHNSVGKSYCGNTTVRGGWTSVACEETEICTVTTEPTTSSQQAEGLGFQHNLQSLQKDENQ